MARPRNADREAQHYIESFNRVLRGLALALNDRYPDDAMVARAHRRIVTLISISPLAAIDLAGPYLYSYRDQIYAAEADPDGAGSFFIENEYDAELRESIDQGRVDLVRYIIPLVKDCTRAMDLAEKKEYVEMVVLLLDNYIEYLYLKTNA